MGDILESALEDSSELGVELLLGGRSADMQYVGDVVLLGPSAEDMQTILNKMFLVGSALIQATCRQGIRIFLPGSRPKSTYNGVVGFVGLGNMGGHMATNLAQGGFDVRLFDKFPDRVDQVRKEAGVELSTRLVKMNSLKELLDDDCLSAVITMLPSSPQVLEVYGTQSNDSGLIAMARKNTLFIDCTTGDPKVAEEVHAYASSKRCTFVDAPVSGGVPAAQQATLTFMVGGSAETVSQATPLLQAMGKQVFHCGPVGTGLAAKICNNMLLAVSMIAVSEVMDLGGRLGLDPHVLSRIINSSSGRCWSSEVYNPVPGILPNVPSSKGYVGGFGVALMTKDLGLAQQASTMTGCPTPLGSVAHQLYRILCQSGYAQKDFSSIYQFLSKSL
ncbi:3-hydroxyisobutyrate dehydrogenase mitochondrial [Paragonimus heterotremus]|uniref:3-hydroxyisobutyrate dehydrogenase n=1 Tax=Paragonimus heterotremus TaxID=100268 RepID=A0A8J4SKI3_9TREM|nr:3-hydroxyisobutyrate dehydrogenase mitochondrial [Paragonimus heterotremus]